MTEDAADPGVYSATHFVYDKAQRVWLMLGETWEDDGADEGDCPDNYDIVWAREFRYDSGRARYLNRELSVEDLIEGDLVALTDTWTDYDGDTSYNDYSVEAGDPPTLTNLRWYEPGTALKDPPDQSTGIEYYHTDHLGTTREMTDSAGSAASAVVFTAFGERVDAGDYTRYGYVGAHGYQSHDFPNGNKTLFLHVGWRYYDPGTGRFLQRDPAGISGGLNVYLYLRNNPNSGVDPTGLHDVGLPWWFDVLAWGGWIAIGALAGPWEAAAFGLMYLIMDNIDPNAEPYYVGTTAVLEAYWNSDVDRDGIPNWKDTDPWGLKDGRTLRPLLPFFEDYDDDGIPNDKDPAPWDPRIP